MSPETPACLASIQGRQSAVEHVESLLNTQRQATAHLLADLRHLVLRESSVALNSQLKDIDRRLRQIERAFEFYRRAETRVEILISHFGGSL